MELVLAGLVLVALIGYLGYDHHVRKKEEAVAEAQRLERRAKRVANTKKETKKAVALEQGQVPSPTSKTKPPSVEADVTINGPWFDVVEPPVAPIPLPETPPLAKAPIQPPLDMSFDDSSNLEHVVESEALIQPSEVNPTDPPQDLPPNPPLPVASTISDDPPSVSTPIRMDTEDVSRETHPSVVETQSADSLAETNSSQAGSLDTEESKSDLLETFRSPPQDETPDLVKTPALLDLPSLESIRPDPVEVHLPSDPPPLESDDHSSSVDEFSEFLNQPTNLPFEGLSRSNDFVDLIEPPSNLLESNAAVPTVLFVDDSKMVREQMRNIFEEAGCRALLMTDGRDVMTFFSRPHEPVDLIFSDVEMGDVGGFELYQHLQSNSETASIPFVFVTGSMDNVRKGESLGCKHALLKPYNERHIQVLFEQLLPAFFTN